MVNGARGLLAALVLTALVTPTWAQQDFASTRPTERVDYWQQRQAAITAMLADPASMASVRLVFIGDSITDFWLLGPNPWMPGRFCGRVVWDESFGGRDPANRAINLGISGDRLEHMLHRLRPRAEGGRGELDRADLNPEFIILLAGINNSWDAEQPAADSVYAGIRAVVRAIHARKPDAIIVLQSLLPTNEEMRNAAVVRPVNARIAAMATEPEFATHVRFLNLYPSFVDSADVQIDRYFNDGLHPSEEGYRVWRDRLTAYLTLLRRAG